MGGRPWGRGGRKGPPLVQWALWWAVQLRPAAPWPLDVLCLVTSVQGEGRGAWAARGRGQATHQFPRHPTVAFLAFWTSFSLWGEKQSAAGTPSTHRPGPTVSLQPAHRPRHRERRPSLPLHSDSGQFSVILQT